MRSSIRWIAALGLATFAVSAALAGDAGKAVVAVAYDGVPQQVHPVLIQEIDGRPQPKPLRDTIWLDPGKHTLRLAPLLDDNARIGRDNSSSSGANHGTLEIEVQAGKRYLIGAKIEGRRPVAWKPVVLRVEDIG